MPYTTPGEHEDRLLFIFCFARARTAFSGALLCIRTADTMLAAFFCSVQIHSRTTEDKKYHKDKDNILCHCVIRPFTKDIMGAHTLACVLLLLFFAPRAYSSLSFLSAFTTRNTTIAAITATAIPPPIAAPTLSAPPVTIVPIVYTK